jgi:ATP-binding cassette subfamily B (MDR/TAP) protein 1
MAFGFSQTNVFVVYAVVFYTGALFVKDRHITMQNMFDALFSIMFAAFAAGQAAMYIPDVTATYVAARSIFQLIDLPTETTQAGPAEPKQLDLSEFKGHIEFKDIWFRYPNRPNYVLRGLNMVVEPGEKVAMVGPSGCGKSTVMGLLMRFYEPSKGQILLDGEDIKHYSH